MHQRKLDPSHPIRHSHESGTYVRAVARSVLEYPDKRLSARAALVDPCDPAIVNLGRELVATMRAAPSCIGLAATQIGEPSHVFCMDVTGHRRARSCAGLVVLANARVVAWSETVVLREGCLSVPHLTGDVARASKVVVEGLEVGTARVVRIQADAMEARCVQHELDHLNGFLFVDRVRDTKLNLFPRRVYG